MSSTRLRYLFFRHFHKTASPKEREELMQLIRSGEYQQDLKNYILEALRQEKGDPELPETTADKILSSILNSPPQASYNENDKPTRKLSSGRISRLQTLAAAAILTAISLAGYYLSLRIQPVPPAFAQETPEVDLPPGKDKAYLSLSDGINIDLENQEALALLDSRGISNDLTNGELAYHDTKDTPGYNTLTTPLGGQYKIVLPDGSKAWLNAGSKLKFPNAFDSRHRTVEMSGEIYFEIASNPEKPFLVKVAGTSDNAKETEVKVIGTHFNVSSYDDEPALKTTLLEGAIEISRGGITRALKPGQQAQIRQEARDKRINIQSVDAEAAIAWKEGRFEFNDNIRDIMRQVARWYDVEVVYEGNFENKSFAGVIPKKNNVSEVLHMIELTGGIRFEVNGRTITVKNIPI